MALAGRYDAFLFDLDGVLYRADSPVEHAAEAVAELRRRDRAIVFMTNNSSRTPVQVVEKLERVGVHAEPDEVVTSALVAADVLRNRQISEAFVIGEDGVLEALARAGIRVLDVDASRGESVVVGWDRGITYDKLRTAALLIQRGALLVATNADATYPAPDGLWPGAGSLLAAVVAATGAEPLVVGKPHPPLFEAACRRAGGGHPLVVGDRLDTDIEGARAVGLPSLLVLTGISTREDALAGPVRPTYLGDDLRALFVDPEPPAAGGESRPQESSGRGGTYGAGNGRAG